MKYHGKTLGVFLCSCILAAFFILPVPSHAGSSKSGLTQGDFRYLAREGIEDSANSYAWSITSFKGDLYVGVNRHHGESVMTGMEDAIGSLGFLPSPSDLFEGPKSDVVGDIVWAEDFRGAIYRLRDGKWSMVHQSQILEGLLPIIPSDIMGPTPTIYGYYPESYGYRNMTVYNDYIYALGIGPWNPNMPLARVLRSPTGDPGSWEDVSGIVATATNPRGLIEYKGSLYISASLPGQHAAGAGIGLVYRFDPSSTDHWKKVSDPGFGNGDNAEIPDFAVFNGFLYASTLNYNTGFEVWKTDGSTLPNGKYIWKRVVKDGFGDTWNQWGMTLQPFNGYLYIGTAVGGMVLKDNQPVGIRPFDVIRLDAKDRGQLLVGAPIPSDPPPGWPSIRVPLSGRLAGFANPLNVYVWSMGVYDGWLYLGTFDISSNIYPYLGMLLNELKSGSLGAVDRRTPVADQITDIIAGAGTGDFTPLQDLFIDLILSSLGNANLDAASAYVASLAKTYGGADVWKTKDGIHWSPVTLNGFGNCFNGGVRRLVPVNLCGKNALIVGTANGFTGRPGGGCEVLSTK